MDSAKNAVKSFMHKDGKHDTTVHETFNPAVTNEVVEQHRHENVTTAIDKEVHQDHHHTTVQPIKDVQKLEEQHHHNVAQVEHRKFEHGNDEEVQRRLQAEKAKFQDTTTRGETHHTTAAAPTVAGEHVHHHVHETIQPVVQRQTIEPHVVHTVVPIHETHHSAAQHHATSALPAISMADFKKQGGGLHGREQRSDFFEGEPQGMAGHTPHTGDASSEFRKTGHVDRHPLSSANNDGLTGTGHSSSGLTGTGHSSSGLTGSSTHGSSGLTGNHGTHGSSGLTGSSTHGSSGLTGSSTHGSSGLTGDHNHSGTTGATSALGSSGSSHHDSSTHGAKKPSLLDRLNPMKDTDGDGKKGVME